MPLAEKEKKLKIKRIEKPRRVILNQKVMNLVSERRREPIPSRFNVVNGALS